MPRRAGVARLVVGVLMLGALSWPATAATPSGPQERAALSVDGTIRQADLQHDSHSDLYRAPTGAVPIGSSVLLRLRAAAGDLDSAQLHVADRLTGATATLPMVVVATDADGGEHGYDYWQAQVDTPATSTVLDYWFVVSDSPSRRYLADDPALDGGTGALSRTTPDGPGWQLTVYDPAFMTPAWTRGAVVYQVFPDRFEDGDRSNDPSPDATPTADGATRYRRGDVYGLPIVSKGWDELPEGYCRAYQGVTCDEQPLGRDFFGGDLAGLTAHLDQLTARGITAIYLNPIFAAPSNHRYDTSDYFAVDPDLGTDADLDAFIAGAHERGIRVILDGVFNHVSSDSPWFDRFGRYPEVGACESVDSPYRDWFTFRAPGPGQPSPCAPSQPGGADTYYESWGGYDTIPAVTETPGFVQLITGPNGVVRYWLRRGIDGWRLDVANDLSPEFLRAIRAAARAEDPDALIIGEDWNDASPMLLGDQADSVMDYRFRRAVIGFVNGDTPDLDGAIGRLTANGFANAMAGLAEDYPPAAWGALLHMVDSHDTTRIRWTLTPGDENAVAKEAPGAVSEGVAGQRLVAAIELTFPGMADVYYGDEVGLSGQDDPDDRRPFPWGHEDPDLLAFYTRLGELRREREALRDGGLDFLAAEDATGSLAYLRRSPGDAALVAVNVGVVPWTLDLDVTGLLPEGLVLSDALSPAGEPVTISARGRLKVPIPARSARILLPPDDADLRAPSAPEHLDARAGQGIVKLSWQPVEGAARYLVWRSLVPGGGYQLVSATPAIRTVAADDWVPNGTPVYHVVTAVDRAGNESGRSAEVMSLPHAIITGLAATGPAEQQVVLSAEGPGAPVSAEVTVPGLASTSPAAGLRVEAGYGPRGSEPGDDWTWTAAEPIRDTWTDWIGYVSPEAAGTYLLAVRASADGGRTWQVATSGGRLVAVPSDDRTPPATPAAPTLVDVGGDHITIRWDPVEAPDLYRYLVYRSTVDEQPIEPVAMTTDTVWTDTDVTSGTTYSYTVVAQDTSFNTSASSEPVAAEAAERVVTVTFRVTVPPQTPADATLYIAGDFQGWAPGDTPMTQVAPDTWSIDLPFKDGTAIQYKYTRGSWEAVEKDLACGEIPDRTLTVDGSKGDAQVVEDAVGTWRDVDACP